MDNFFNGYLQISLLNKLNTYETYFELFTTIFVLIIISQSSSYNFNNLIKDFLQKKDDRYEITLHCEEVKSCYRGTRLKGSDTFKSILVHIKNKISQNKVIGLKKIREYYNERNYEEYDMNKNEPIIFMSNQTEEFRLKGDDEPDILFKLIRNEHNSNDEDEKKLKVNVYELKLIGGNNVNLKTLQEYVELRLKSYKDFLHVYDENLYVFTFNGSDTDNKVNFKMTKFNTTCDMSNLFFSEKESLLEKIKFFQNNKEWYLSRSKPYTLGICTYGPPGCGKTSFEKALAKMLDRHLIIVDISKINSTDEADALFFNEKINDRVIPFEKRIYVLPDFDCQSDITNQRIESKKKKDTDNYIVLDKDNSQKILESLVEKEKREKMNLSKLLNILDGIPERTGQIIIFNTNHPDHLDKALLRPGRVDIIFKFDKIDINNTEKMIQNYYDTSIPEGNQYNIPHMKYTPAELFNIFSNYFRIEDALDDIENWSSMLNNIF